MKLLLLGLATAFACLVSSSGQANAQTLSVGDDAPPIQVARWVKGEKVEKFDKTKTYIVEFWATWCGPCRQTIPQLSQLQKTFRDKGVKVVGVSVLERDPKAVDPFVQEMGDRMTYSVAVDSVPDGETPDNGKMVRSWMEAAEEDGLPTAFVVKNGKVAWIGPPMELDDVLEVVLDPGFNLATAAIEARAERAKAKLLEQKIAELKQRVAKYGKKPNAKQLLDEINKTIAEAPEIEDALALQKYVLMLRLGEPGVSSYAVKLIENVFKDEPETLNDIAWSNLDDEGGVPEAKRDPKVALKAALRALELTKGEIAPVLDTLAMAYFKTGDPAKALKTQEQAIKVGGDNDDDMNAHLKLYKKAVADASKKP